MVRGGIMISPHLSALVFQGQNMPPYEKILLSGQGFSRQFLPFRFNAFLFWAVLFLQKMKIGEAVQALT